MVFRRRELSIEGSVSLALSRLDSLAESSARPGSPSDAAGISEGLRSLCSSMNSAAFLGFVVTRRKEVDALRAELPDALKRCVDPARLWCAAHRRRLPRRCFTRTSMRSAPA